MSVALLSSCSVAGSEQEGERVGSHAVRVVHHAFEDLASTAPSARMLSAGKEVQELLAGYGDSVAVSVKPLDGSPGFSINGGKSFISASMIKLLILAEFLDEVDSGEIGLDDVYVRDEADVVGGTGQIQYEDAGSTYTYADLARYMVVYSDNTASNVLIEVLGIADINGKAAELGLEGTDLQRKLMVMDSELQNHISSDDAAAILLGVANHSIASDEMCSLAEQYLLGQMDGEGLAQGIPEGVAFGHKTGTLETLRHDGGIVYAEDPYVIVVLADIGIPEANALMQQVSAVVYRYLG